jgi:hypothetical protein
LTVEVLDFIKRLLFGRKQLRRLERDEEHLTEVLNGTALRDGDLIFHTSQSSQSKAIQLATHSPYSHCGMLVKKNGYWMVYEAALTVKTTPLRGWIYQGKGEHFVVKRLHDAATALTPAAVARLDSVGKTFLRLKYDKQFAWSNDEMYCSELIWKVYDRGLHRQIGQLQQLKDFDLSSPTVQAKLRERYGDKLPLNETVISPVSIFRSSELVTVLSR